MTPSPGQLDDWTLATPEKPLGYSLVAVLEPDTGGGFTVFIEQLPGVVSEGEDEDSAIRNVREACQLTIRSYKALGIEIPWVQAQPQRELRVGITVPG